MPLLHGNRDLQEDNSVTQQLLLEEENRQDEAHFGHGVRRFAFPPVS